MNGSRIRQTGELTLKMMMKCGQFCVEMLPDPDIVLQLTHACELAKIPTMGIRVSIISCGAC